MSTVYQLNFVPTFKHNHNSESKTHNTMGLNSGAQVLYSLKGLYIGSPGRMCLGSQGVRVRLMTDISRNGDRKYTTKYKFM